MADGSGPLNPHLAGSILLATPYYVACGDNLNKKILLTLSPAKPNWNVEGTSETYELCTRIYGDIHYITKSFCENVLI
jgi:hypothetical protein